MRIPTLCLMLASLFAVAEPPATAPLAITPANRFNDGEWWKTRHEEKKALAAKGGYDLVFIGDSITQGWEGPGKETWEKYYAHRKALNLGYSGDRTENVLWRLSNGELENVDPELFILMIGTNNTGHRQDPPEQTADGIKQILSLLKSQKPKAKILLLSIFPRDEKPDGKLRQLNAAINDLIQPLADGSQIHWLDLSPTFLAQDGILPKEVMPDFLHPKEKGYQMWAEAMEDSIAQLTKTRKIR
jgi:lysophospholipase L1-like esterase